jgi:hypothetical protein
MRIRIPSYLSTMVADPRQKRRFKQALIRSRRRTIDPLKWDTEHLKRAFLDPTNNVLVRKDDSVPVLYVGPEADETNILVSIPKRKFIATLNTTKHETLV